MNPRLLSSLFRFAGLLLFVALAYWGADSIKSDGLSYWVKYIARVTAFFIGFYAIVISLFLLLKRYNVWRYPDFDRELSAIESNYIDKQKAILTEYVESRNFASKKYWIAAWVLFGLFIVFLAIIAVPAIYLADNLKLIPDHSRFGSLVYHDRSLWTTMPLILVFFTAVMFLAAFFAAITSYVSRPFAEAITVSLTMEETPLGEKAKTLPDTVTKYVRYGLLDNYNPLTGERLLAFIGWRRRIGLLKWSIGLGFLFVPLLAIDLFNGTRFYEKGLRTFSPVTFSSLDLDYSQLDSVIITCLYDDAENESSQQFYYFHKGGKNLGRMRYPVQYDEDFDRMHTYFLDGETKFKKLVYTFEQKSKNVERPFEYCATKLLSENPEQKDWLRKIMHLDEFEVDAK